MPSGWSDITKENAAFKEYYTEQLQDAGVVEGILKTMGEDLPTTFRVAVKGDERRAAKVVGRLKELGGDDLKELGWCPMGFYVKMTKKTMAKDRKEFYEYLVKATDNGALVRQEAVSMIPPMFLEATETDTVLDMCAAPGSKTTQILEDLNGSHEALLVANDLDKKRLDVMITRLSRLPASIGVNLVVTNHNAAKFPTGICKFSKILADVICSGDGTMRKNPVMWRKWKPTLAANAHTTQISILLKGLELLEDGGRLVYSTCSLNPIENEAVISHCLTVFNGENTAGRKARLLDVSDHHKGITRHKGLTSWKVYSHKTKRFYATLADVPQEARPTVSKTMFCKEQPGVDGEDLTRCMRFYPQSMDTGGFFVAVMSVDGKGGGEAKSVESGGKGCGFTKSADERLVKDGLVCAHRVTQDGGKSKKVYAAVAPAERFLDNPLANVVSWGVRLSENDRPYQTSAPLLAAPSHTVPRTIFTALLSSPSPPFTATLPPNLSHYPDTPIFSITLEGTETTRYPIQAITKKVGDTIQYLGDAADAEALRSAVGVDGGEELEESGKRRKM